MDMTESPQQPGYSAAQQQQAAAYAAQQQQQAYAQQAYAQPAPNVFDKLPMNIVTFGLAAGGAVVLFIGLLIAGSKSDSILDVNSSVLGASVALMVATAIAITTGPKYRNAYRLITLGLAIVALGSTVGALIGDGELSNADGAVVIGRLLFVAALGLFTASTFTMAEPVTPDPQQLAAMQAAQAQQAAQQQAAAQQAAAQQQYQATQAIQQQTGEQPTTWQQQQPPQQ